MSFEKDTLMSWQLRARWWVTSPLSAAIEAALMTSGTRLRVEGDVPREPVLFAMNSTHPWDFLLLRRETRRRSVRVLSIAKAKYLHQALPRLVFRHGSVLPIGSRGYIIVRDAVTLLQRPIRGEEYAALRDAVDGGEESVSELFQSSRDLIGWGHDPAKLGYGSAVRATYEDMMRDAVQLAGRAIAQSRSLHIYPEGTVRERLGPGRNGAVQLALALSIPIVPVGLSNARAVFQPGSRGNAILRFGQPIDLTAPSGFLPFNSAHERLHHDAFHRMTTDLMERISELLEPPWRAVHAIPERSHPDRFFSC